MTSQLSLRCIGFAIAVSFSAVAAASASATFIGGNGHRCTTTTAQNMLKHVSPKGRADGPPFHQLVSPPWQRPANDGRCEHYWGNWHVAAGGSSAGRATGGRGPIISMSHQHRRLLSLSSSSPSDDQGEKESSSGKSRRRKRRRVRKGDGGGGEGGGGRVGEAVGGLAEAVVVGEAETGSGDEVVAAGSASVVADEENEFVEVKVRDIRDVGGGSARMRVEQQGGRIDEADGDGEGEGEGERNVPSSGGASGSGDDLDKLLADARRMRASSGGSNEDEASVGDTVKNIISTIVTADFFVVMALLLWFLAGIFCSYVLKDDAVQIAFNGIFEPVVQPALGLLMVASAAGAMMGKEDDN